MRTSRKLDRRSGLAVRKTPSRRYRLTRVSLGGVLPAIDLDKALRLAEALEDEERARRLSVRK